MRLKLEFYIDQPVAADDLDDLDDLDELAALVREAIDEKIGETDYMVEEVSNYDISFELID